MLCINCLSTFSRGPCLSSTRNKNIWIHEEQSKSSHQISTKDTRTKIKISNNHSIEKYHTEQNFRKHFKSATQWKLETKNSKDENGGRFSSHRMQKKKIRKRKKTKLCNRFIVFSLLCLRFVIFCFKVNE